MLDGIAITFDYAVKLFTYSAVAGMALSILLWFIGVTLGIAIKTLKKI